MRNFAKSILHITSNFSLQPRAFGHFEQKKFDTYLIEFKKSKRSAQLADYIVVLCKVVAECPKGIYRITKPIAATHAEMTNLHDETLVIKRLI